MLTEYFSKTNFSGSQVRHVQTKAGVVGQDARTIRSILGMITITNMIIYKSKFMRKKEMHQKSMMLRDKNLKAAADIVHINSGYTSASNFTNFLPSPVAMY